MPGSDQKINYQLRPSKSIERKMMCDLVKQIQIIEGTDDLRYIGMGAKYFADFMLFHNEFGISDMISIEAEVERAERFKFNKPLKNIEIMFGQTKEVLPQIGDFDKKMNFVWLDYDDLFSEYMLMDVETLCRQLCAGSLFFISCNYSFVGNNQSEKMDKVREQAGNHFDETIPKSFYTGKRLPVVIQKMFNHTVGEVLNVRNHYEKQQILYRQLLFITYKDGAPMMTVGGILVNEELNEALDGSGLFKKLPYTSSDSDFFDIQIPKFTYKEIQLVLRNIPITDEEYNAKREDFHGISLNEIRMFEKIYRYYPNYTEGAFIT